jgi:hypothetical protein
MCPSDPVMIPASPLALRDRATIARLLLECGTPSICAFREVMEAGALMSYATAAAIERVASLKQDYQQRIAVRPPPTRSSFLQREDLISNCLGQGIDGLIRSDGGARTLSGSGR